MIDIAFGKRSFGALSAPEILALAISSEEEDAHRYRDIAVRLRPDFPDSAAIFDSMAAEEDGHRRQLIELSQAKFGPHIPLIQRDDVRGFARRRPIWLLERLSLDTVRREAETMEFEAGRFYRRAAQAARDADIRRLLGDLAAVEQKHERHAAELREGHVTEAVAVAEANTRRRMFVLQVVQPGLAGLMDGSVSTLAPIFAAALATGRTWDTFLVGLAASLGAGISMGLTEALSDDGQLTGRGHPWLRGLVCGIMTTVGGLGHTLPFLIPNFHAALISAVVIVALELVAIAWIRWRFMDTPFLRAAFQIVVGGALVFLTGIVIGSA